MITVRMALLFSFREAIAIIDVLRETLRENAKVNFSLKTPEDGERNDMHVF